MSWLNGLSSLSGHISSLTRDLLTDGSEESGDVVTNPNHLAVRQRELEALCAAQKVECEHLQEQKASAELQLTRLSAEYHTQLQNKEVEINHLKARQADLQEQLLAHSTNRDCREASHSPVQVHRASGCTVMTWTSASCFLAKERSIGSAMRCLDSKSRWSIGDCLHRRQPEVMPRVMMNSGSCKSLLWSSNHSWLGRWTLGNKNLPLCRTCTANSWLTSHSAKGSCSTRQQDTAMPVTTNENGRLGAMLSFVHARLDSCVYTLYIQHEIVADKNFPIRELHFAKNWHRKQNSLLDFSFFCRCLPVLSHMEFLLGYFSSFICLCTYLPIYLFRLPI
uniref:Uncharacterized protein n=1 Tax=Eptatretus burgeri TaxID=7764 RepID=A0A8C4QJH8_EPTBU